MFSGSIPALVTPFRDGAFDEKLFRSFVDWQISEGSSALVPWGTNPEVDHLIGTKLSQNYRFAKGAEYQRKALQVVAILGSKTPNIQNLAVGGVANAINLDSASALNMQKLYQVKDLLEEVGAFVQQVYFPDVAAVGGLYAEWTKYGAGVTDYLSVPELPLDGTGAALKHRISCALSLPPVEPAKPNRKELGRGPLEAVIFRLVITGTAVPPL